MAFSRLGKAIIYQLGVGFMDLAGALKPPERVSEATGNADCGATLCRNGAGNAEVGIDLAQQQQSPAPLFIGPGLCC